MKPNVYTNDDYAGLSANNVSFYFGYEQTVCRKCGERNCSDEDHYEDLEWCFVATFPKARKEIFIKESNLEGRDMAEKLLHGIGLVLNQAFKTVA